VQYGYQTRLRPGLAEALLALADTECELVLWSRQRTADAAHALFYEKVVPAVIAADRARFMAFQRHMRRSLEAQYERRYGTREGACFTCDCGGGG
jgi:hypothetical protein